MKSTVKNVYGDKKFFTHTAKRTKLVNVGVTMTRGGIRL